MQIGSAGKKGEQNQVQDWEGFPVTPPSFALFHFFLSHSAEVSQLRPEPDTMRLLSLTLGGIGLLVAGVKGAPQSIIPPEQLEALCRANERAYTGPPMPRIRTPTFSGTGCPSGGKIGNNYMGKWSCSRDYDVQLLIPDLNVAAEPGSIAKADCKITFYVDKLGAGWQLSLWDGVLDVDAEMARGSELRMKGSAKWEGLTKGVSFENNFKSLSTYCGCG